MQTITAGFDRLGGETKDVRYQVAECFDQPEESLKLRHISHQDTIQTSGRQQATALYLLDSNLDELRGDFGSRFDSMDQQNQSLSQASHQAANQLSAKLEGLSKVSHEQSETVIHLLRQMQQQNNLHHVEESIPASTEIPRYIPAQGNSFQHHHHVECEMKDNIDRLYLLAPKEPQTISSDEVQSIIEDLESILNVVIAKEEEAISLQQRSLKRKRDQYDDSPVSNSETQYWRDVKRVRRILSASDSVIVNDKIKSSQCIPSTKCRMTSRAESREYRTEFGTIRVNYIAKQAVEIPASRAQRQESSSLDVTEIFLGASACCQSSTIKIGRRCLLHSLKEL